MHAMRRKSTKTTTKEKKTKSSTRSARSATLSKWNGAPYRALVIVESPAKTKTLKNFLGPDYRIEASMGHVRDLPQKKIGIDIEQGFEPSYEILPTRKELVKGLKEAAKAAEVVYLATDPDREGEAIAWHLQHALGLDNPVRIEFNEITESAVLRALNNPRTIDKDRVDAQQARRVLDRVVGYQVSPILWKKMGRSNLSAGRVQTVALRLIVEREREIRAFVPEEYWRIFALLSPLSPEFPFEAELKSKGTVKIDLKNAEQTQAVLEDLRGASYVVDSVDKRQKRQQPPPPFITSTLQQEASRKLGFAAKRAMSTAQTLYEGLELGNEGHVGLITYMRTDSVRVSEDAQANARDYIQSQFGDRYLPAKARQYKTKGKAQDAHEAIRPTDVRRTPDSVRPYLDDDQFKLYELIWKRFLASQMAEALLEVTTVNILAKQYLFRASGTVILFDGFQRLYMEGKDTQEKGEEELPPLPPLEKDQPLKLIENEMEEREGRLGDNPYGKQSFTQPPPRYNEATLVKTLEQNGIGRPSTYAAILSTLRDREYVEMEKRAFVPTGLGEAIHDYLIKRFPDIFEVKFTAHMEQELDEVEEHKIPWVEVMKEFYAPFRLRLEAAEADPERIRIPDEPAKRDCPQCGSAMVVKSGRFGKFLACTGYPECKTTLPFGALGILCPTCGEGEVVERKSKKGKIYFNCSNKACEFISWNRPTGEKCPQCGHYTEETKRMGQKRFIACSQSSCGYRAEETIPDETELALAEAG